MPVSTIASCTVQVPLRNGTGMHASVAALCRRRRGLRGFKRTEFGGAEEGSRWSMVLGLWLLTWLRVVHAWLHMELRTKESRLEGWCDWGRGS